MLLDDIRTQYDMIYISHCQNANFIVCPKISPKTLGTNPLSPKRNTGLIYLAECCSTVYIHNSLFGTPFFCLAKTGGDSSP